MNEADNEPTTNLLRIEHYKAGEFVGYKWASTEELPELMDVNVLNIDKFDWSAIYTCLDLPTAEGYLVNRLPDDGKGNGVVYMHKLYLTKDLKIVLCNDKGFQDGSYKSNGTVSRIKKELRDVHKIEVQDSDPLLATLGKFGYAFRCYHDKDGTEEIVIAHSLKPDYLRSKLIKKYIFKAFLVLNQENIN